MIEENIQDSLIREAIETQLRLTPEALSLCTCICMQTGAPSTRKTSTSLLNINYRLLDISISVFRGIKQRETL